MQDLKLRESVSRSAIVGPDNQEKGVFLEQKTALFKNPTNHSAPQPKGHPLVGGAEDEEGAGFWNGYCLLFQLQLGQGAWPGTHGDLRLVFFIIAWGEGRERNGGHLYILYCSPGFCALNATMNPWQPAGEGSSRPMRDTRMPAESYLASPSPLRE